MSQIVNAATRLPAPTPRSRLPAGVAIPLILSLALLGWVAVWQSVEAIVWLVGA